MPLIANGKIDRAALPAPDRGRPELDEGCIAPRTATETRIAAIWIELLKRERIGVEDNFFDLGGHSLLAMGIVARIRGAFGIELPLAAIFETPTIAGMAEAVSKLGEADASHMLAALDRLSEEEAEALLSELEADATFIAPPAAQS